jgi:hypothetical protein
LQRYCLFLNWQAFLKLFFKKKFERTHSFGVIYHNANELGKEDFFSSAARLRAPK